MEVLAKSTRRDLTLLFRGELDHPGARDAVMEMERALNAALPLRLTLDFSEVSFMDSSGIAVVMRAYRRMNAVGGRVELTGVPPQARRVLDTAGIANRVPIRSERV